MKNKLFFLGDYKGVSRRSITATDRFPTAAELSGNFSGDLPIYDPRTGQQFNGNIIPTSRINQKSQQIIALGLFPTTNVPSQSVAVVTLRGSFKAENCGRANSLLHAKSVGAGWRWNSGYGVRSAPAAPRG